MGVQNLIDEMVESILTTSDWGIMAEGGHCLNCGRDGGIDDTDLGNLKCRYCGYREDMAPPPEHDTQEKG